MFWLKKVMEFRFFEQCKNCVSKVDKEVNIKYLNKKTNFSLYQKSVTALKLTKANNRTQAEPN